MKDGKTLRCCYDLVRINSMGPDFRQCTRKATVTRPGGCYCKVHDPVEKQRKADERQKAWDDHWKKKNAAHERDQKMHELFPKLVAALDSYKLSPEHQKIYEQAFNAL